MRISDWSSDVCSSDLALRGSPRTAVPYVLADGRCAVGPSPGTEMMAAGKLPGWGLVFGSFASKTEASARIEANQTALNGMLQQGKSAIVARTSIATHRYSALLVGLGQDDAGSACRQNRKSTRLNSSH